MVDLRKKPYFLSEEDVKWVDDTIASMTDEEKVGQLFINMVTSREPDALKKVLSKYHVGGIRYQNAAPEILYEQNKVLQENSKIPLLIASNCEAGGNGGVLGGTAIANGAAVAASQNEELAYLAGSIGAKESAAVGCNWNFAPLVDLPYNWRNTIVQVRAFNSNPDDVIKYMRAFNKGTREQNMATCVKHFPGDGTEENDQHLLMGVNNMSCEEWENTFGRVYRTAIDDGVMSIMVGHIALPAYSKKLRPDLTDADIKPATLSPELIQDLLKTQMGFNGLVVTDASHMIGLFGASVPRREQVPGAIAAGCDMFLFFNDQQEDFQYMLDGYRSGVISQERMLDALRRILGMKAALKLHKRQATNSLLPAKEELKVIGCEEHKKIAERAAQQYVTLVKDTKHYLPMTPQKYPKLKLVFIAGEGKVIAGKLMKDDSEHVKSVLLDKLRRAGFQVDDSQPELKGKTEELREKYDACLVILNVVGMAQYNSMRLKWALPVQQPWYVSELPTVFLSLNFTNHLIDVPMAKTYVNAYLNTEEAIDAALEKLMGMSAFCGKYQENVFCERWDTRI